MLALRLLMLVVALRCAPTFRALRQWIRKGKCRGCSSDRSVPDPRATQFDHLALDLLDEDALVELQQRLKGADCEVTGIIDHGGVRSVYFTDPNGIALEASWWVHDPTGSPADYHDARQFADPSSVLAFSAFGSSTAIKGCRGSGAMENRTPDLFHAMEALYQLSYSPERSAHPTSRSPRG
jgi:hypothetical protein